jgi:5-methylthioadenosine/S-adenosylhomocysteine deaminase
MLAETRAAALLPAGLPAHDVLHLATLGSALSLGLAASIGSLEPGKAADMICIDLDVLACQADVAPENAVVFAATRQQVSDVWIAGRAAVSAGSLLAFDEQELAQIGREWSQRIHGANA